MSKTPEEEVEALLAGIPGSKPCAVERNEPLAKALRHFLKLKDEGETKVSLEWFYENKLKGQFNGPSMTTVRRWARQQ